MGCRLRAGHELRGRPGDGRRHGERIVERRPHVVERDEHRSEHREVRVGVERSERSMQTYDKIGTFSSDFAYTMTGITTGGFGNIGIYGWSLNPLHEYYIAENWLGKKPNFTKVGTFTIDGEGTYDVMTNKQTNQPNITGMNQDFVQFWSVRTTPRQCGHISISKHFAEWASLGLQLGNLEEVRILVEAQNNSGEIDFTTGTVVVTK
jgi:hypothetical protein